MSLLVVGQGEVKIICSVCRNWNQIIVVAVDLISWQVAVQVAWITRMNLVFSSFKYFRHDHLLRDRHYDWLNQRDLLFRHWNSKLLQLGASFRESLLKFLQKLGLDSLFFVNLLLQCQSLLIKGLDCRLQSISERIFQPAQLFKRLNGGCLALGDGLNICLERDF